MGNRYRILDKVFGFKTMRGDFPFFFFAPVVFMALMIVTAVLFIAWQTTLPVLNQTAANLNVPQSYKAIPAQIGNNLYSFDTYLVIIFFFAMLGSIMSTVLLNADLTSWIVGVILLPFVFYISAFITNIARTALTLPILAQEGSHLKLSLYIMANMQTIVIAFAVFYVVAIAVRLYFYRPTLQQ